MDIWVVFERLRGTELKLTTEIRQLGVGQARFFYRKKVSPQAQENKNFFENFSFRKQRRSSSVPLGICQR